jgi:hypothetical protein
MLNQLRRLFTHYVFNHFAILLYKMLNYYLLEVLIQKQINQSNGKSPNG